MQGGLITRIAAHALDVDAIERPIASVLYNESMLKKCGMFKNESGKLFWCSYSDQSHVLALPRPFPYGPEFWDFFIPSHPVTPPAGSVAARMGDLPLVLHKRVVEVRGSSGASGAEEDEEMPDTGQGGPSPVGS